jgi:hypothetical protein
VCSVETSYYSGIVVKYIQQHIYTTSIRVSREVVPIDKDKEYRSAVGKEAYRER